MLIISIFPVIIESVNKGQDQYTFFQWKTEVWDLFRKVNTSRSYVYSATTKFERMGKFEQTPEFVNGLRSATSMHRKRPHRIWDYIGASSDIAWETSLLRKPTNISRNLFEIIHYHNGCSPDELSKLDALHKALEPLARISKALKDLESLTFSTCWFFYKNLMHNAAKLAGTVNLSTIHRLSSSVNEKHLSGRAPNSRSALIKSLAEASFSHMIRVKHPSLEHVVLMSKSQVRSAVAEVYQIEVQQPCSMLCELLNPIKQYFAHISLQYDEINVKLKEKLVDFSCSIASFASSSDIIAELVDLFVDTKTNVRQKISLENYKLNDWKADVVNLTVKIRLKKGDIWEAIKMLQRMKDFELEPELSAPLEDIESIKRSRQIGNYLNSTYKIVKKTTLLHKSKSISDNLLDIVLYHNGCTHRDLSNIEQVAEIFRHQTHIYQVLHSLNDRTISYCWKNYNNLVSKIGNLLSDDNFDGLLQLSKSIKIIESANIESKTKISIESLSKEIALHLSRIENSPLEDIDTWNISEIESTIEHLYETEIYNPSSVYCSLVKPVVGIISDFLKYRRPVSSRYEDPTAEFTCRIETLPFAEIIPRIVKHFLNIRLDIS